MAQELAGGGSSSGVLIDGRIIPRRNALQEQDRGLLVDVNKLLYGPNSGGPTVIENVFSDTPTFDYTTQSWSNPDSSKAYDRFAALNPPAVYPKMPDLLSGVKSSFLIGLGIVALVLVMIKK